MEMFLGNKHQVVWRDRKTSLNILKTRYKLSTNARGLSFFSSFFGAMQCRVFFLPMTHGLFPFSPFSSHDNMKSEIATGCIINFLTSVTNIR